MIMVLGSGSSNELYSCSKCLKSYKLKLSFRRHVKYECERDFPKLQCHLCGNSYNYKSSLKSHLLHKHKLDEGNVGCNVPQ